MAADVREDHSSRCIRPFRGSCARITEGTHGRLTILSTRCARSSSVMTSRRGCRVEQNRRWGNCKHGGLPVPISRMCPRGHTATMSRATIPPRLIAILIYPEYKKICPTVTSQGNTETGQVTSPWQDRDKIHVTIADSTGKYTGNLHRR